MRKQNDKSFLYKNTILKIDEVLVWIQYLINYTIPSTKCNFRKISTILPPHWGSTREKKHVNRDSHIASSPISQSFFFEKVCYSILASSQKKLHGYIEILKFYITIKKLKNLN